MRRTNKALLAGGVVYPAGTAATPELEAIITNPAHWAGEPDPEPDDAPVRAGYDSWRKAELEAEVDKRNADRDPDGDTYIDVGGTGTKADLVAALEADDAVDDD